MRLLVVADLHYSLPQFDWVLDCAADFDMVVMAGDHLDLASLVDARAQTVVVNKYFSKLSEKTRLVTCSGNHDLDSSKEAGEKIAKWLKGSNMKGIPSDGETFLAGDTLFTVCPWWDGPVTRTRLEAQLEEAASQRNGYWIWIHHAPPDKSPVSWGGARYFGDRELRSWIERYRPDIVLSAMCINRLLSPMAPGSIASGRPGCSTLASNSEPSPPISSSIPTPAKRSGFRRPAISS